MPDIHSAIESDPAETIEQLGTLTTSDWLWAGGLTVVAALAAIVTFRVMHRLAGRRLVPFVAKLLARLTAVIVFIVGFFYATQQVGVTLTPFLGLVGLLGLALAFAFQEVLENFIAGIFLSARRPFSQGDEVTTGGHEGTVEEINLRELTMRTYEGERVFIPNSEVWQNPIVNHTAHPTRRTTLEVGVAYGSDLPTVSSLLALAVAGVEGVASEPPPQALAYEFGASSINYALRFWHASSISAEWEVRDRVLQAVHRALGDAGVEIPFPQRVVEIKGADAPS